MKTTSPPNVKLRKRRRLKILLLLLLIGAGVGWLSKGSMQVGGGQPDGFLARRVKVAAYASIAAEDEIEFERIDPANPGGWLTVVKETPQPLGVYQKIRPIRPTPARRTIVLQPLGPLRAEDKRLIETLRQYTSIFFQLPSRVARPLDLKSVERGSRPGNSRGQGAWHTQYDASQIIHKLLVPRLPADACVYLGVTMADLHASGLNFVFGQGSFVKRAGVYSLCRYFPEYSGHARQKGDAERGLRRACQVLGHETGHMFSISHCVFYHCSMNGSNSLLESDAAPLDYCPICHRKLLWNIGFDGVKRYRELEQFYRAHGLHREAAWVQGRLARWTKIAAGLLQPRRP